MPVSYQQNKVHIYKWRASNLARVRTTNLKCYYWKKISKIFLAILID